MPRVSFEELLKAGVHFGHLKRKWNPLMAPYIFDEKKGIHIIDLNKTVAKVDESAAAMKQIAKSGKKILFVATKKQAKDIVAKHVKAANMPYVTERWSGGMLTNFATVRKAIRKMNTIDKMLNDGTFSALSKRERLQITRQRDKLDRTLGSIADLTRMPAAMFIVDINKEHIAVAEARKLNIPIFAMVDTNSNPKSVDFAIPANDDAGDSINIIVGTVCEAIKEGLEERKGDKDKKEAAEAARKEEQAKAAAKKEEEKKEAANAKKEVKKEEEPKAEKAADKKEAPKAKKEEKAEPKAEKKTAKKEEDKKAEPKAKKKKEEKTEEVKEDK